MKKSSLISQCKNEYTKLFTIDWIEEYNWSDVSQYEYNLKDGIRKINEYIEVCFNYFSKSIVSGEYILKGNLDYDLLTFTNSISNDYPPCDDTEKLLLYKEYQKLDNNLRLIINKYRSFISFVNNQISQEYHQYIVSAFYAKGGPLSYRLFSILDKYIFHISLLDHSLSYDRKVIQELILLNEELTNEILEAKEEHKSILRIVKEKCCFLLNKLVYFDGTTEYYINFASKKFDFKGIESAAFKEFDKQFEYFHKDSYSDNDSIVREWQSLCVKKQLKIGKMILLMKNYIDSHQTDIVQVNNLLKKFNDLHCILCDKHKRRQFDIYALSTMKNYMYNSRLSFMMRQKDYDFSKLRKDMDEISSIQNTTFIYNFYPYKKAVEYIIKDIRNLMQAKECSSDNITERVAALELYLSKLSSNLKWCESKRFYPVQNIYNECISVDSTYDGLIFTASSFSRPLKYDKLNDSLQELKSETRMLKNEIALYKERKEIEALKGEIDGSKKNNIEILGAFTAVITFLFGSANIFSNDKISTSSQILNIVSLGLVLLLFVSAIYFLTIRKEEKKEDYFNQPRFWAFGIGAIVYAIILAIIVIKLICASSNGV